MKLDGSRLLRKLPLAVAELPPLDLTTADDGDGAVPAELREWLVRLRLLDGVPFAYLVADSQLLPRESIRWFYVDRRWTDALIQGALAVGTVNSDDRTQLTARYPDVRAELDHEERNLRRAPASDRYAGAAGPISGFVLRSRAVSGWPALHVRAFSVDTHDDDAPIHEDEPGRVRLLRLERLAPAVLLCLFDGVPKVVHLEEPRQGVQFGFDTEAGAGGMRARLAPRNATDFSALPGPPIDVHFRGNGGAGVVDIQQLERDLKNRVGSGAVDGLDSSEYALQLIRFPFRQVFGAEDDGTVDPAFRPTIGYQTMATNVFRAVP